MSDPERRDRAMQQYLAESPTFAEDSKREVRARAAVLDTEALRLRRQEVARAKTGAIDYATQAVEEATVIANEIGVPLWKPNEVVKSGNRKAGFDKGYVLLRDGSADEFWLSEAFGAVIGINGRHLLRGKAASSREIGDWVASLCGYDHEKIGRVFTMALTDVPMSTSHL